MGAIDDFLAKNEQHAAEFSGAHLDPAPARKVAIVTCMDARLEPAAALGFEPGDAHVIRNAGGIVTDDVIRSLLLSQRLLGTSEVMVVGHTECGLLTFTDDEMEREIEEETGVRPPMKMGAFRDLEARIRESLARLEASPFLRRTRIARGFVYSVRTGQLTEVK